jgi:D-threo-aldose 1-dehydrogenase
MKPLEKAFIGRTKLQVTRLGVGGAAVAGLYQDVAEDRAVAAVKRALELGINFFDTAPLYGCGKSELRLGRAFAGRDRDSFVVSTKVGYALIPDDGQKREDVFFPFDNAPPLRPVFDFSYDAVMRSLEQSLERLRINRVDIVHIHDPDNHYREAMRFAYPALEKLRREGVIGAIGAGMNQAKMLAQFARDGDFDCFLLAGRYTLIDHTGLSELLPVCLEKKISVIIGGPYNSGILATGASAEARFNYLQAAPEIVEKVRRIEQVCARHCVPLKAAALQFPLAHPAVASVIPGARSVEEVEENRELVAFPIPSGFWEELRSEGLLPEEAPVPQAAAALAQPAEK